MVLSLPMLPLRPSHAEDAAAKGAGPASLEEGARGKYNAHFVKLAEYLAAHGLGRSILRLEPSFNASPAGRSEKNLALFAQYWRQIVQTMRGVPGAEQLQFCWSPCLRKDTFAAETAWPGDALVDFVGVVIYDASTLPDTYPWPEDASAAEIEERRERVWHDLILHSEQGLLFWKAFAQRHGKPLCLPEWRLEARAQMRGGMDNPYFIEQVHAFVADPANRVAFHCFYDVTFSDAAMHGPHRYEERMEADYPAAAAKFRELFGR